MLSRARLARNRGRRSTLEMPLRKSWQAQHSVHLSVCLRSRGSIWQLSEGLGCCRARGSGRAKSWQAQHFGDAIAEVVAGAAFCASERVFAWLGSICSRARTHHRAALQDTPIERFGRVDDIGSCLHLRERPIYACRASCNAKKPAEMGFRSWKAFVLKYLAPYSAGCTGPGWQIHAAPDALALQAIC